jgi:peptide/nickel transport system substrate-binding protein
MFVKTCKSFLAAIAVVAIAGLSATMPAAAETPQRGGTLTVGFSSDTKTLDPTFSIQWSERQVLYLIYNTLIRTGQGFTLNPELAKSWEVSDDGLRIVFKLQEGVKFHDGTDFDAEAAKWNLDRRLDESVGSPQRKQLLPVIKSIEVVDKYTFAINLKEPFPPLLGFLAERSGFVISPTAAKKYGEDYGSNPVGTGPFVFREWVRGGHIIVERNDDYWEEGLPYLDRVVFSDISGAVVGIQRLITGEIDFISELPPQNVQEVETNDNINLVPITVGLWYSLQWHWYEPPFDNSDLRKAVAHAIDRDRLNEIVMAGKAGIANGPTPPGLWWHDATIKGYDYDPARAKELLAKSGYDPAKEIVLVSSTRAIYTQISQLVQEQLTAIGLNVRIEPVAASESYSRVVKRLTNFTPTSWTQRPDPDGLLYILFHSKGYANSTGYNNPKLDALLEEARRISDIDRRKAIYSEAQRILVEDLPYVSLFFSVEYAAMSNQIRDFAWVPDNIPRFLAVWKAQ